MRVEGNSGNALPDTRGVPLPTSPRAHNLDQGHQTPTHSGWWRQPDPAEFTPAQLARAGYRAAGTGSSKPPRAPAQPRTPRASRVVPATEADTIVATYRAGATIAQIHADTGRSPHTIRRILRAAGVTITMGRRSHGPGITPAQVETAIAARRAGATIRDAAARAGAPLATVHRVLRDAGLDGVRVWPARPARFDRDAAVAEYLAGESSLVVAVRHGVSSKAVLDAVRAAGATPRDTGGNRSLAANDPAEAARIVDAYQAGATVPTIAADTGHATSTIYKVLRDTGITLRDDRARTYPDHVLQAAGNLYASGLSRREVADRLDISLNAVAKGIRHVGATPRPRENSGGDNARHLRDLMASHGATAADIRRYARRHGLHCPTRGLPPLHLIRSYLNAQGLLDPHGPCACPDPDHTQRRTTS